MLDTTDLLWNLSMLTSKAVEVIGHLDRDVESLSLDLRKAVCSGDIICNGQVLFTMLGDFLSAASADASPECWCWCCCSHPDHTRMGQHHRR